MSQPPSSNQTYHYDPHQYPYLQNPPSAFGSTNTQATTTTSSAINYPMSVQSFVSSPSISSYTPQQTPQSSYPHPYSYYYPNFQLTGSSFPSVPTTTTPSLSSAYPYSHYSNQYYGPNPNSANIMSTSPSTNIPLTSGPQIIQKAPVSYASALKSNIPSSNNSSSTFDKSGNWRVTDNVKSVPTSSMAAPSTDTSNMSIPPWQKSKESKKSSFVPQYTSVPINPVLKSASTDLSTLQSTSISSSKKSSKWDEAPIKTEMKDLKQGKNSISTVSSDASSTVWPDSLKKYVTDAFESCGGYDVDKNTMEIILKEMILEAVQEGTLYTTDWTTRPLPVIKKEKNIISDRMTETMPPSLSSTPSSSRKKKSEKKKNVDEDFTSSIRSNSTSNLPFSTATVAEIKKREERARRFKKDADGGVKGTISRTSSPMLSLSSELSSLNSSSSVNLNPFSRDSEDWWDQLTIIGSSSQLEKSYLRLTSAPDPSTVRPLPILKQALKMLQTKYKNCPDLEYFYLCDQLKSIRQDLTVQRIRNYFTISVYETHARIALEKNDLGEYNQCQTQLKSLYDELLTDDERDGVFIRKREYQTTDDSLSDYTPHPLEFLSYRILYFVHTQNHSECNRLMSHLTLLSKNNPWVSHALSVRAAVSQNNYVALFKLYRDAPGMAPYLMDAFIERERVKALKVLCSSYRPSINVGLVYRLFAFDNEQIAFEWLRDECNVTFISSPELQTSSKLSSLSSSTSASTASKTWESHGKEKMIIKDVMKTKEISKSLETHIKDIQIDTKCTLPTIAEKVIKMGSKIDIKGQI